ncbi:hypothetical protein PT285_07725 [Lactobacillus sp. ESL0791]|uniref:hypothetical protein n=1 Tax=Lactobacillus sp. ESL0791 TaxID=2983234 RepID=UPI0023F85AB2|nr:hypothetical protein [Lactobacillus sp. ESL0791]MDF7639288.1 hypothetical protein [Lactobacillus sp. ESL0791]
MKPSYQVNNADLSEMVRATVQMSYLYVFNTCPQPEKIMQIRFNYWKTDILGTCREKLLIDRATKTFSYNQFLPNGNEIKQSYVLKTSVANFLDSLDSAELLCEGEEESEGEINYELTITYDEAPSLEFAGHFDFDGLPDDYPDFASKLLHFITLHSKGQILEPDDFEYELADTDSYVYCSVKLERGGRSYYYISDGNKVSLGDQVIVPVGDDNHHLRGEVVKIGVYFTDDVPLPVDETKHIVRNLDEE